jgi:molybdopterin molybdotransferase
MAVAGEFLSLDEALACVLAEVRPLEREPVALADAAGRFLAEDALASVDLPPFDSSAMDGFAVRAADTPGRLRVVGRVAAGSPAAGGLGAGEAMGIATGGALPPGADAVVPIERVSERDGLVEIGEPAPPQANVRPRGGDVGAGAAVVGAGTRLGPRQLGALAAAGCEAVVCACRPRVAVACTGSELRRPGEELAPGQIYESNGLLLEVSAAGVGAVVESLGIVRDDREAHRRAIERGLGADVLLTTGGVSVGPHDLVRETTRELGVEERFWRVAVKPGKPLSFGVHERGVAGRAPSQRTLVFGIPGNPVSTLVLFELFVRPALLALQHAREPGPVFARGRLRRELRRSPRRDQLVRARLDRDSGELEPLAGQESHMIVRAAEANALVHVPRGEGSVAAGADVRFLALG